MHRRLFTTPLLLSRPYPAITSELLLVGARRFLCVLSAILIAALQLFFRVSSITNSHHTSTLQPYRHLHPASNGSTPPTTRSHSRVAALIGTCLRVPGITRHAQNQVSSYEHLGVAPHGVRIQTPGGGPPCYYTRRSRIGKHPTSQYEQTR